jgi:hypothetical protein
MKKNKKRINIGTILLFLFIIFIIFSWVKNYNNNKYWEEATPCMEHVWLDAKPNECTATTCFEAYDKKRGNVQILKCTCQETNKTFHAYCSHTAKINKYGGDPNELLERINTLTFNSLTP